MIYTGSPEGPSGPDGPGAPTGPGISFGFTSFTNSLSKDSLQPQVEGPDPE